MAIIYCSVEGCDRKQIARELCTKHYQRWKKHGDPLEIKNRLGIKFIRESLLLETDDCILWPYAKFDNGYGAASYKGKQWKAHRLALFLHTGVIPEGMVAAHAPIICHNKACINVRHLRWATLKENTSDRVLDGTQLFGEIATNAKLREKDVIAIRQDDRPSSVIAKEYGMGYGAIRRIKAGSVWKHVKF